MDTARWPVHVRLSKGPGFSRSSPLHWHLASHLAAFMNPRSPIYSDAARAARAPRPPTTHSTEPLDPARAVSAPGPPWSNSLAPSLKPSPSPCSALTVRLRIRRGVSRKAHSSLVCERTLILSRRDWLIDSACGRAPDTARCVE